MFQPDAQKIQNPAKQLEDTAQKQHQITAAEILASAASAVLPGADQEKKTQGLSPDALNKALGAAQKAAGFITDLVMPDPSEKLTAEQMEAKTKSFTGVALGAATLIAAKAIAEEYSPERMAEKKQEAERKAELEEKKQQEQELAKKKEQETADKEMLRAEMSKKINLENMPNARRYIDNNAGKGSAMEIAGATAKGTQVEQDLANMITPDKDKIENRIKEARGELTDKEKEDQKKRDGGSAYA